MLPVLRDELLPTPLARSSGSVLLVFPPAMRIERRRAIGADNPEILDPIVVGNAIDVIEDQCHPATTPAFALTAHLAPAPLQPPFEQSMLDVTT